MKNVIAFHAAHEAAFCIYTEAGVEVFELEKMYEVKHLDLRNCTDNQLTRISDQLFDFFNVRFDIGIPIYYSLKNRANPESYKRTKKSIDFQNNFLKRMGCTEIRPINHHLAHANSAFYQSPFETAFCIVNDAGIGHDTKCATYSCKPDGVHLIESLYHEMHSDKFFRPVTFYTNAASTLSLMKDTRRLDVAGKLMGLSAYGEPATKEYEIGYDLMVNAIPTQIAKEFKSFKQQANFALGVQHAFEEIMLNVVARRYDIIENEYDGNIVLCGGGALNILTNARIQDKYPEFNVFVPPNPGDESVAHGAIMQYIHEVAE